MKKKVYDVQILDGTRISIKEDASFFTTDTNAVLVFNVLDQAVVPTAATITLVNTNDKSVVNETMNLNVKEASYTIPANVIEHAGSWVVQVIFEYAGKDYTVPAVRVPVTGHILDGKEPRLFAVESFENLMTSLEAMKDSLVGEVGGVQTSIDDIRADLVLRADALIDEQGTRLSDLVTEYASKAETLEADYASDLATLKQNDVSLTAQLQQTEIEFKPRRVRPSTEAEDNVRPLEVYNKSGQGTGSDTEAFVIHHYTDRPAQITDNVGSGTVLQMTNARNPSARPDKPNEYVGTGIFIDARRYNYDLGINQSVFIVDQLGDITKTGLDTGTGTFVIKNEKEINNYWGFDFNLTKRQRFAYRFRTGGSAFIDFLAQTNNKAEIEIGSPMVNGFELRVKEGNLIIKSENGNIVFDPTGGRTRMYYDGNIRDVQPILGGFTADRPLNPAIGFQYFDTNLSMPIWHKGSDLWVDATGVTV